MKRSAGSLPRVGLGGGPFSVCGKVMYGIDVCRRSAYFSVVSFEDLLDRPAFILLTLSLTSVSPEAQLSFAGEIATKRSLSL